MRAGRCRTRLLPAVVSPAAYADRSDDDSGLFVIGVGPVMLGSSSQPLSSPP